MADDEGSGRSALGTVALVVGVVVVVWLALGLLHVIATLVWGAIEVAGLIALVLVVWWLFFKKDD
jgi:dolichol kinase